MSEAGEGSSKSVTSNLTDLQRERIDINRQRAIRLKEIKKKAKPYTSTKWYE
jgi:hypothetical protein